MLRRKIRNLSILEEPIGNVLTQMNKVEPGSQEYSQLVDQLERLMEMKSDERKSKVSPDMILIVCGNLLGILIIVAYEQKHVLVSRGLSFVLRPREQH